MINFDKYRPPTPKSVQLYRKIGQFSLRIHGIIRYFFLKNYTIYDKNKVYSTFITFFIENQNKAVKQIFKKTRANQTAVKNLSIELYNNDIYIVSNV